MLVLKDIVSTRQTIAAWRGQGARIALVPTMGALHRGHLALVEQALAAADRVMVSLFVNPLQFGPNEDFARYPRTLEHDLDLLENRGVHALFAPTEQTIYPRGRALHTLVRVPMLADMLCGVSRPGFFDGVATVVNKLFNIVAPDVAVFGEKDFQQLMLVRRLVADLNLPIAILGVPTVREADGLALSSRNQYLNPPERARAPALHQVLQQAATALRTGAPIAEVERDAIATLVAEGFRPDYFEVRQGEDLVVPDAGWRSDPSASLVVLAAAWLGTTRLIDNLRV